MAGYKRIFVDENDVSESRIMLSGRNQAYVYDVLRMKPGEKLIACDGTNSFLIRLSLEKGQTAWTDIEQLIECQSDAPINVSVAFGCVRPDPMEQIFRHCAELGVEEFSPIIFQRCNRRPREKKERWQNIVAAACSQSGRLKPPIVNDPVTLDKFLSVLNQGEDRIFLSATARSQPMYSFLNLLNSTRLTILVGPEGGVSADEIFKIRACSFFEVSLSPMVLRTETAAIVGVGMIMSWTMGLSPSLLTHERDSRTYGS